MSYTRENLDSLGQLSEEKTKQVRGLYISALVFAALFMLGKILGAVGLGMFNPVLMLSKVFKRPGSAQESAEAKDILSTGKTSVAALAAVLLDSMLGLSVLLLASAIAVQNDAFRPLESQTVK